MEKRENGNWAVVRAVYADSDYGEYCKDDKREYNVMSVNPMADPVKYTLRGEEFGSFEELALKLAALGDDTELYLDMNDREVAKLCSIRRMMVGK